MNDEQEFSPRLDMIETEWSMFRKAHQSAVSTSGSARNALVLRYAPAIRSYVHAITRSDTDADELSQEVIIRLLKGDFGGADPNRGRFRDLLKVAVKNMTRNHWAKQNRRNIVDLDPELVDSVEVEEPDSAWNDVWQQNVLGIAWSRLESFQEQNEGSVLFSALQFRADHPDADSPALAEMISKEHDREVSAATFRQQLRRARVRFAEYIVEEVANGIDSFKPERVYEELISIGLFEHVKDVMPSDWATSS